MQGFAERWTQDLVGSLTLTGVVCKAKASGCVNAYWRGDRHPDVFQSAGRTLTMFT